MKLLRKLYWYIYARFRLWYLYRGNTPFYESEKDSENNCPNCYWEVDDSYDENCLSSSKFYYGFDGYISWTDKWKCPRCGEVFDMDCSI